MKNIYLAQQTSIFFCIISFLVNEPNGMANINKFLDIIQKKFKIKIEISD